MGFNSGFKVLITGKVCRVDDVIVVVECDVLFQYFG